MTSALAAGQEMMVEYDLNRIAARAEAFRVAGVPPIFAPQFYGEAMRGQRRLLFPTVDFLLQYGAGVYGDRMREVGMSLDRRGIREGANRALIPPAKVEDVFRFRTLAFDGDRIDAALRRDSTLYVAENFHFGNEGRMGNALENDQLVFLFLEEALQPLSGKEVERRCFDGNPSAVTRVRWYLGMDRQERSKAIDGFVASLPGILRAPERKALERISTLFPDLTVGVNQEIAARAAAERVEFEVRLWTQVRAAIAGRDFRTVPQVAFVEEPWRQELLPQVERFFQEECARLAAENPTALFGSAAELHEHMPVPYELGIVPRFKAILDEVRLKTARELSEETFLAIFPAGQSGGAKAGIGHTKSRDELPISRELREFVVTRWLELTGPR